MDEPEKSLHGADEYIARMLIDWQAAGVAVAVVQGTELIYAKGFGLREVDEAVPIDPDTLFQVGSTTKAFTAAAVGILVEEGKLSWDDPVVEHLPWFRVQDAWVTQQLTIRDTLTHRSGITGGWYFALTVTDPERAVRDLRYARCDGALRDCYLYSNPMYAVAGKVIEAASGSTWGEFIRERLLKPLGMRRSGTSPYEFWDQRHVAAAFFGSAPAAAYGREQARDPNVAMPHAFKEDGTVIVMPWQSYDSAAAAGSLVSSAVEMGNWLLMHLNEGRFSGRSILKPETVRELHALQNARLAAQPPFDSDQFPLSAGSCHYAMGWFRALYCGQLHLSHGGGMLGFPAYVAFMPERHIGVVVLANGPQPVRDELALNKAIGFWLLDRLLGEPRHDWSDQFLGRARSTREAARREEQVLEQSRVKEAPPTVPLAAFTGVYEDRRGHSGPVCVSLEDGCLHLRFPGAGAFAASLQAWHGDLFRMHVSAEVDGVLDWGGLEGRFVAFTVDPWGKVSSMRAFGAMLSRTKAGESR